MWQTFIYGLIASSALLLGAVIGTYWRPSKRITGVTLAFSSGTLISALCFELFPEAAEQGGFWLSGIGLVAGAGAFVLLDAWLDRMAAPKAGPEEPQERKVVQEASRGVGLSLLAGVTLDGIPENLALGVSIASGLSLPLLVAIFASNLPEALVGANAMRDAKRSKRFIIGIWTATTILLTLATVGGDAIGESLSPEMLSLLLSFSGGAVLASLADTLMPEAFEHGKPWNAFGTAAGFFISFVLAHQGAGG
ncbi:MAG: zinc transporter ZIP family [Puniceicoccaceae bacterium 5H]|nr:MAG: zinc transporter ZIP family [Puniceicoccaceae bacterium 5H]